MTETATWPPHLVVECPDALGGELCDLVVERAAGLELTAGVVAHDADGDAAPAVDPRVRRVRQAALPRTGATAPVYDQVRAVADDCNQRSFGFDLGGSVELAEDLVVVAYGPGDFYNWHLDLGGSAPTRKLSMSISLSEPSEYSGGALSFPGRVVDAVPRGGAVVFPSFLLHAVQPVKSGRRIALLAWINGPRFR